MPNPELQARLFDLHAAHRGGRVERTLRSPYKMIRPLVMRKLGTRQEVDAPTFWGGTFSGVLPEAVSTMIWRTTYFDEEVCLTLLRYLEPGNVFVDIGAHFGFFSLLASHLVGADGEVFSIEAMPSTYRRLVNNMEKNRAHDNVRTYQGAAYDNVAELEFFDFGEVASSLNSAFGSRGGSHLYSEVSKVKVQARPADAILESEGVGKIDLIKIDAESSEKFVLAGLRQTIARHQPVLVMEVGDVGIENGVASQDLIRMLDELSYRPYHWVCDELQPFHPSGPVAYANLTFLPPHKAL